MYHPATIQQPININLAWYTACSINLFDLFKMTTVLPPVTTKQQQNQSNPMNTNSNNQTSKQYNAMDMIHHDKVLYEPELHIIGTIESATNISYPNCFLYYKLITGNNWLCVGGDHTGQTHIDYPYTNPLRTLLSTLTHTQLSHQYIFNHTLDIHYYTNSLQGWPKLFCELYTLDGNNQHHVIGYGFIYIPCMNGTHNLTVNLTRPLGTTSEELINLFMPNIPSLISTECIYNAIQAKNDRPLLCTETAGQVHVKLDIVLRNMNNNVLT